MAVPHVTPGEVINLEDRIDGIESQHSRALVKTEDFEAMLIQLSKGDRVPEHAVTGPITVQCLRGEARFVVGRAARPLEPGDWMFLEKGEPHAVEAVTDCSLLVTIVFAEGSHG